MFKVGDIVLYKREFPTDYAARDQYRVIEVLEGGTVLKTLNTSPALATDTCNRTADWMELVSEVEYEDAWRLNDGKTDIPSDAKVLKEPTGEIVCYKLVKKPIVKETIGYPRKSDRMFGPAYRVNSSKMTIDYGKLIFTETDGVLTDVRFEKE